MGGGDVWLIANPRAGGGRGVRHAGVSARVLTAAGVPCRLVQPASVTGTGEAVRQAVAQGARAVVACGGDGTVHAVLQDLVGTDVPLGIVPGGSGDDIALALGMAAGDAEEAAQALARAVTSGRTRAVDVGEAETAGGERHAFLGVLSTGFDSAVNERANRMSRLGGQRYTVAMVRELASFRPATYVLTIDGERIEGSAMLVAVGNGSSYGGGMRICPAAEPDDGLLDLTWLSAVSKPTFLRAFPSVYRGEHVHHPYVRTFRGRDLTIDAPGQVAYADGERVGSLPVSVHTRVGGLRVLDGRPADGAVA